MITAKHIKALFLRYGIPLEPADGPQTTDSITPRTWQEVGDLMFLTRERVRQLCLTAKKRLRDIAQENGAAERIPRELLFVDQYNGSVRKHFPARPKQPPVIHRIMAAARVLPDTIQGDDWRLNVPVVSLELSVRSYHCLQNAGLEYVGELVQKTECDMFKVKNLGRRSMAEIKAVLREMNLSLGSVVEGWHGPLGGKG